MESIGKIDRFVVAALVDRLIFGSAESFSRADAIDLREMMPPIFMKRSFSDWFQFSGKAEVSGSSMAGAAAGVGNVKLPTDSSSFEFDSAGRRILRAGQWKIRPAADKIEIEQVMASDADEGRSALIRYRNGEPMRMDILVNKELSLGFMSIGFGSYQPWKTPKDLPRM